MSAEFELEESPRTPPRLTGTSRHHSESHGSPSLWPRLRPRYAYYTEDHIMGLRQEDSNRHISLMRSLSPRRGGRSRPRSTSPSSPSSRPHQRRCLSRAWISSAVAVDDGTSGRRSQAPVLRGEHGPDRPATDREWDGFCGGAGACSPTVSWEMGRRTSASASPQSLCL